ncbi:MAG: lamin tail domain-containing protein [Sphingobacteriales bacterium JAD_PAG50586_3]|nr:MAG: lamin tail domain-containing protein [Sphingobacteriales bacterium JAD_PAG50586_3]
MKKLIYTTLLALSALAAKAQSPSIVFLHADAFVDTYEFMTLQRCDLTNMSTTDAGICSNGSFRTNEGFVQGYNNPGLADVPAGTIIQVRYDNTGTADYTIVDGRGLVIANTNQLNQANANPPGEQVIAFTGTLSGGTNCSGSGTNTFVSGINWGNAGWTSGATDAASSKAPGSATDVAIPGTTSKVSYTGSVNGDQAALTANITNPANWTTVTNGDGIFSLKNILFNEPNYLNGVVVETPAQNSVTLDLSGLAFTGATADTRYMVLIAPNGPASLPVDRYTCYTGIAPTVLGSPSPAASVTGQTAANFCGTIAQGVGQIVYFDYTLPSALTITGLATNTLYHYTVVACNGNGYTANFSSAPYISQFFTGVQPNTTVEFTSTASTVNENVGAITLPLTITNPSQTASVTIQIAITGGTGTAADITSYNGQIVIPAGATSATVAVTVNDDILVEGTETVVFSLQNVTGGQGTPAIGANNPYTLTITDNDAVVPNTEVNFDVTPGDNIENVGLVGVVLSITNPSPTAATTVEVQITGGTGTPADIANYTTQTVTFPAGSTALQPLTITVTDDNLFEPYETISFAIRNISGGQGTAIIGADSTFTLGIIDNDVPNVVINEIHYNPAEASGSPDAQYEFIELYNAEPVAFDLEGYTFSQGVDFTFPANSIINPGQYIIVAINAPTYSGQGYDVYQWNSGDLDNGGETIEFKTVNDDLVDIVTYDELTPWPTGANNAGPSLELIDEPLNNAVPQNWRANGPKNGTPGQENTPLSVNENSLTKFITINGYGNNLYVTVNDNFNNNFTINIIDLAGRTMGTFANLTGSATLNTSLPAGLYIIQCVSNSAVFNQKVVLGY